MLRCVFIVECGIVRFLSAMRVFDIRASWSSPRLPLCQMLFFHGLDCWASRWRKIAYSITHSVTQLIWCPGNRSCDESLVFVAGAARCHIPTSTIYLHGGGLIITCRHISDTCTMCWQYITYTRSLTVHNVLGVHYIHPQSDCTLFLDRLCQTPGGCPVLCSGKNLLTSIHRQVDRGWRAYIDRWIGADEHT